MAPHVSSHERVWPSYPSYSEIPIIRRRQIFIFCGDYVKDNAYKSNPYNLDEFKTNVSLITVITPTTLQTVSSNMVRRGQKRMQHAGGHFRRSDVAEYRILLPNFKSLTVFHEKLFKFSCALN